MKFPLNFGLAKKENKEYFLALLLRDEKAYAVIFEEIGGKVKIIGEHEEYFTDSIEEISEEKWLETLDAGISTAESSLPPGIETKKTIFGVKENWVEEAKIKKEYLARLKKASDALGLSPIGFLVIHEAIAHRLTQEEGAPISALLLEVDKKNIALTLLRAGKAVETMRSPIEDSLQKTTDKLLHSFDYEILPSRLVIFDGTDAEHISQAFIGHSWSKNLPFLHVPQVTILPRGFDARSVLAGVAVQMGFEILDEGIKEAFTISNITPDENAEKLAKAKKPEEEAKKEHVEPLISENPEDKSKTVEEEATVESKDDQFGFMADSDVVGKKASRRQEATAATTPASQNPSVSLQNKIPQLASITSLFGALSTSLTPLTRLIRLPQMSQLKGQNKLFFILPGVLLILILLFAGLIFTQKATVTIYVSPQEISKTESLQFSLDEPTDEKEKIIHIESVTTSEEGSATTPATGKKSVGEKAKGTVTLFNSDSARKQLSAGATIIASNDLAFVLDKDVSVASASGDIFSGTKPGTAQVAVTAKVLGTEYNLPSNTKFTVEGTNTLAAKNEQPLSGGTKKDLTVVAKKDVDKLTEELTKQNEGKAKGSLEKKIGSDAKILPFFLDVTIKKKEFNKKVEEEAKEVKLTGVIEYTGAFYKNTDLVDFAKKLIEEEASNMTLPDGSIAIAVTDIKQSKNTVVGNIKITAKPIPTLNTKDIQKTITGKSLEDADTTIKGLPRVARVEVVSNPRLPFFSTSLPRISDNITIIVKSNE